MRLGVLIEGRITRWQQQALERISGDHEIYLLNSTGHRQKRSPKHAFYYALNLFTVRNRMTRKTEIDRTRLNVRDSFDFSPSFEGAWAVLPAALLDWVGEKKLNVIIKFGLGLLRIPEPSQLPIPILSYHHGDPRKYRGRPAGFYELVNRESFVGQIVQRLSSKLDAGTVYAFGQSRVVPHSYRKTLIAAYSLSPYLLEEALENVRLDRPVPLVPEGRNHRLPANPTVVRFCAERLRQAILRGLYGAFVEKRWNVATAPIAADADPVSAIAQAEKAEWQRLPVSKRYNFYADPFFGADEDEIFVEGLCGRTGKGEIVRIQDGSQETISGFGGHVSYPSVFTDVDGQYLIPETSGWCPPTAFAVRDGMAEPIGTIDLDDSQIIDPTFLRRDGKIYLFANVRSEGPTVLHLWFADSLFGKFTRHPASPIRASGRGCRMAGEVAEWNGKLYRLGQDWRRSYGDGILAFEIVSLSPTEYREELIGEAHFGGVLGPHTVSHRNGILLFDYYTEEFSALAGVRRVLGKL